MKKPYFKLTENQATSQIINGLEVLGWRVYKIYSGGVPGGVREGKMVFRKKDSKFRGVPDLIALKENKTKDFGGEFPESCFTNKVLFIEVKGHNGKTSPEQLEFIKAADHSFCQALVAHSIDEVLNVIGEGVK